MYFKNYIIFLIVFAISFSENAFGDLSTKKIEEIENSVVRILVLKGDKVGGGSAFLINNDGNFLTNHHVIKDADKIRVLFGDSDDINAEVIFASSQLDLAVLKIDYVGLPVPIKIRTSEVKKGEQIYASGFPTITDQEMDETLKLTPTSTLTNGIISNVDKSSWSSSITDRIRIQHTASINKGNSGGPLLDKCGDVIGVNTFGEAKENFYLALSSIEIKKFLVRNGVKFIEVSGDCSEDSFLISNTRINSTNIIIWAIAITFMALCLVGIYFLRPRKNLSIDDKNESNNIQDIINRGRVYYLSGFRKDGMPVRIKLKEEELIQKYGIHIGRSNDLCDKTIPSKEISRIHARVFKEDNNFYVEDLGSSNGVYVNNNKLESFIKNSIKINDKLTLGDIELVLTN